MEWRHRLEARNVLLADQLPFRGRGPFLYGLNTGGLLCHTTPSLCFLSACVRSILHSCKCMHNSLIIPDVTGAVNPLAIYVSHSYGEEPHWPFSPARALLWNLRRTKTNDSRLLHNDLDRTGGAFMVSSDHLWSTRPPLCCGVLEEMLGTVHLTHTCCSDGLTPSPAPLGSSSPQQK